MRKLANAAKFVAFLLVFLLCFSALERLQMDETALRVDALTKAPAGSVDVLFVGSSHVRHAFSPQYLYDHYGVASFNAAIGGQTATASYHQVRTALQTQHPRLIVVDLYGYYNMNEFIVENGSADGYFTQSANFGKRLTGEARALSPFNPLRWQIIADTWSRVSEDARYSYSALLDGHSQYLTLTRENYQSDNRLERQFSWSPMLAVNKETTIDWVNNPTLPADQPALTMDAAVMDELSRMIDLCEQNGVNLLFTTLPYPAHENTNNCLYRQLEDAVRARGYDVASMFDFMDEGGIALDENFYDEHHMNYTNAVKAMDYLASRLTVYDLPDRREDDSAAYAELRARAGDPERRVAMLQSKNAATLDEYLELLSNGLDDTYLLLAVTCGDVSDLTDEQRAALEHIGVETLGTAQGEPFLSAQILRGDDVLAAENGYDGVHILQTLDGRRLEITRSGGSVVVAVDDDVMERTGNGLLLYVYDLLEHEVFYCRTFTADAVLP